jgi:hypothetical protein
MSRRDMVASAAETKPPTTLLLPPPDGFFPLPSPYAIAKHNKGPSKYFILPPLTLHTPRSGLISPYHYATIQKCSL